MAPDSICLLYTNPDGSVFPISNAEFMNKTEFKINDTKDIIIDVQLGSTITAFWSVCNCRNAFSENS